MEITQSKSDQNFSQKSQVAFLTYQFVSRVLAIAFTLTSIGLMVTNNQTTEVFGIIIIAKYSYSTAFRFFVAVNAAASVLSLFALIYAFLPVRNPRGYVVLFILDFVVTLGTVAGISAAAAFGWVGKYGNNHTGWMPICGNFGTFCNRAQAAIGLSAAAIILFLITTVGSAIKPSQI